MDPRSIDIVAKQLTFGSLSGGRAPGHEQKSAHFRKGVPGDFLNHFSDLHKAICKSAIGQSLIELGYASDMQW
jgi:hypothetical protein